MPWKGMLVYITGRVNEDLLRRIAKTRLQHSGKNAHFSLSERLHILWYMDDFRIPRRRVQEHFGVARSTLYRWLHRVTAPPKGKAESRTVKITHRTSRVGDIKPDSGFDEVHGDPAAVAEWIRNGKARSGTINQRDAPRGKSRQGALEFSGRFAMIEVQQPT